MTQETGPAMTTTTEPTKLTPRDRKTMRLQLRLDEIDAEISRVKARHQADIDDANDRVRVRGDELARIRTHVDVLTNGKIAGTRDNIEILRRQLQDEENRLQQLQDELRRTLTAEATSAQLLSSAIAARADRLDEPNRHLAALDKDRSSVAYRLEQHLARVPHRALFVESKS